MMITQSCSLLRWATSGNCSGCTIRSEEAQRSALLQVFVEPGDRLVHPVGLVFGFHEEVAFAGIDDELGRHLERSQCVPEFVGLRRRTFRIVLTNNHERWSLHVLDEMNRRTFFVNGWIVVNRRAEERDHPLIDQVLAVVTLPIGDAGAGDSAVETICLRDCPHRHKSAVTPPGHAETILIDRIFFERSIDSSHGIAQIAMPEILHVCTREFLALAITATWI